MNNSHSKILLSVVIPHYNNPVKLEQCLSAIDQQSIGRASIEVIVVDNGSTTPIAHSTKDRADLWLSYDDEANPYVCRNIGIKQASAPRVALLDCTCKPIKVWAEEGLLSLDDHLAVAGPFDKQVDLQDIYSVYYAVSHLNTVARLDEGAPVVVGNFFFRRELIDKVDYLPEDNRSGGDIKWTKEIIDSGINIGFNEQAEVSIVAKSKTEVIRSERRFGRGASSQNRDMSVGHHIKMILYHLLPDKPSRIHHKIAIQPEPSMYRGRVWALWWVTWHTNLLFLQGYLSGLQLPNRQLYID